MLREVILEWLKQREVVEECHCGAEPVGCWFHLTPEQRLESRLESLREALSDDPT